MKAYRHCKWCNGKGCLFCPTEEKKDTEKHPEPLFSAKLDDPEDVKALKRTFSMNALNHAFGPDGEGMAEIERNAAIESILQKMRKANKETKEQERQEK